MKNNDLPTVWTLAKYILILDLLQEVDVVDSSVRADDLERDIHRRYKTLTKMKNNDLQNMHIKLKIE
jgi:hypothetical protein